MCSITTADASLQSPYMDKMYLNFTLEMTDAASTILLWQKGEKRLWSITLGHTKKKERILFRAVYQMCPISCE